MTNTKKKNIALWLGGVLGFSVIFGVSAGLYFSAGDLKRISEKKEYLIRNGSTLTLDGYYFDISATYGSVTSKTPQSLMTANLIRVQTTGETKFEKDASGNLNVSKSSESKLVLELAEEIILTFRNTLNEEKIVVFNSDEAEINTSLSLNEKPETTTLRSNNSSSINSDYFDGLLFGSANWNSTNNQLEPSETGNYSLESLSFSVKEDVFWVDHNGNSTEYKISPRDFYYSYMRTWLFDSNYRRNNGGSKNLDSYFINETGTATRFTDDKEYPNDYLLDLFGIDSLALRNEAETIKTISVNGVDKEVFNVNSTGVGKPNFSSFLEKTMLNSFLLSAAPSEFIDELAKNTEGIEYPVNPNDPTEKETITGDAHKFGIYTYGQRRADNLFASSYIPISGQDNRIIFEKNIYFADESFLLETNTLERIIFEYSNSAAFNDQLFNNFFEGTVSEMPYFSLTRQQKIKIFGPDGDDEFAKQKGLLQVKQLNKTQLVQRTLLTTDPRAFGSDELGDYYFNEEFSKIMYGSTIEELKSGTAQTANSFFNGPGYELRTLMNASINWFTFINNSTKGSKKLWLNHTAPDAKYNSISESTPFDFADTINNIGYFDETGKKVVITEEQMRNSFLENSDSLEKQYKNPEFEKIKALVEKLLDDNNVTNPLEWAVIYPYDDGATNTIKIEQLKLVVETLKQLDSKGRLQPEVLVPGNRDEMLNAINNNRSVSDFNGWGYDYEGIGSFLDGISHGKGISLLGAFSLYSNPSNVIIREQNPEFTKLSDTMKSRLNPNLPEGLKVEDWINLANDDNNNLDLVFGEKGYKISAELARFYLRYQEELSDIEITNLIIELNIIAGFSMESDISIDDPEQTSLSLVLPEYFYPTTESGIFYLSDIRLGDEND